MFLELKEIIAAIGIILLFFVCSQLIVVNILLGFLVIVSIFLFIFSDIVLAIKIMKTNANYLIDPLPQGTHELCIMQTIGGLIEFIPMVKGPKGLRFAVLHKKKIAVINEGDEQFHTRNGNLGFFSHENYDKNINLKECKALEKLDGDDVKEIYHALKKLNHKPFLDVRRIKWHSKKKEE